MKEGWVMFPYIEADLSKLSKKLNDDLTIKALGNSFIFDFDNKEHILIDGRMKQSGLIENISQWIKKVLTTDLNKYKIYTEDESKAFGISIYKYIGYKNLPQGYITSELKREIEEQLKEHRFIDRIERFEAIREERGYKINFNVILVTGDEIEQEVVINA